MKSWKIRFKKCLALVMTGVMVIGCTTVSRASNSQNGDTSLWIEFNELDNGVLSEPFDYRGLKCNYVKPGNNEFKFVKAKSTVLDTANLDYAVNILTFNEDSQNWEWCELGGDMTTGDFEYDKIYNMIIPEFVSDGLVGGTIDFSQGKDMTLFTDEEFKGYYEDKPRYTPDWLIHVYVTDYTRQWDWYFKPNADTTGQVSNMDNKAIPVKWMSNENGWWLEKSDGTYFTSTWYQSPESGLWYYLGIDGYMITNTTTPDGYKVGANGAWIS